MRDLAFLDVETTGRSPRHHEILELAVARVEPRSLSIVTALDAKVLPEDLGRAEPEALQVNGYTAARWWNARPLTAVLAQITPVLEGCMVAGHNVWFDWAFLCEGFHRTRCPLPAMDYHLVDTASLAWPLVAAGLVPEPRLEVLCDYFGISNRGAHSARRDVERTIAVYRRLMAARGSAHQDRRRTKPRVLDRLLDRIGVRMRRAR
jgi:DNA polymerase-3 subunit epsilon